jgi:hypothetical protein
MAHEDGPRKGSPTRPFAESAIDLYRRGLAVLPCPGDDGKSPKGAVRGQGKWKCRPPIAWLEKMVQKHGDANVGILTRLSNITVVDIDNPDHVDVMVARCGDTPLKTATPSGGVHLWYRANGERETNLREEGLDVDVKAKGVVIAPPSYRFSTGKPYCFMSGSWDDLPNLPTVRPGSLPVIEENTMPGDQVESLRAIKKGRRNTTLFKLLLRQVQFCADQDALMETAKSINRNCEPVLPDAEVVRTVDSVWNMEQSGENWAGKEAKVVFSASEYSILMENSDALLLWGFLKMMHGGRSEPFAVSPKGMAESEVIPGWGIQRYRSARDWLMDYGFLTVVHEGGEFRGDVWLFTLSTPVLSKGAATRPNIIEHPPPPSPSVGIGQQRSDEKNTADVVSIHVLSEKRFNGGRPRSDEGPVSNEAASLGNAIRRCRLSLGISQAELARRSRLDQACVSNLETGRHRARTTTVRKVLRGLGLERISDLLEWPSCESA